MYTHYCKDSIMIKYSAKEIKEDFLFIVVCKFQIVADVQGNGLKHHL